MAKRQQRAVEKRAIQQRKLIEAERLAKKQAEIEEQRKKLLEEGDQELSDDDLGLEDPADVFGKMEFNSEVPSLPSTFTLEGHSSPQREVQSHSHRRDNLQLIPKVGVVDPALMTPISVFQGTDKVDPATEIIHKVLNSPLVQSVGATSKVQETQPQDKKKFNTLAIPPSCPELDDDGQSPTPLQRRDLVPQRDDPTIIKEETAPKRKRAAKKKSTDDDSTEKGVITKRRRGTTTPKLPWVDRRDWMEPWCFQWEIFTSYKSDFPN